MQEDWWPDTMRDVKIWRPWDDPQVTVAEYKNFGEGRRPGTRMLWSALLTVEQLARLDGRLGLLANRVETSGPRPHAGAAGDYAPRFSVPAYIDEERFECEPLVLGWEASNITTMILDPGFTMTYGLAPRVSADGTITWDNPAAPEFDVATVGPPSIYHDLLHSESRTVIARDYLQDYLSLRGKHLVHVYYECRYMDQDAAIEAILNDQDRIDEKLSDRQVDVMREQEGGYFAQIWGARYVAGPGELPISSDALDQVGLLWPGLDGPITNQDARKLRHGSDLVYVRDDVLAAYEGKDGFHVSAERGSVSYRNQWAVSHTTRVDRDVIQLELRKLYEGAPPRVIRHWNSYAIEPRINFRTADAHNASNVGNRAKRIVEAMTGLGAALVELSIFLGLKDVQVEDFVGLDPKQLRYEGWWSGPHIMPIAYHIAADITQQRFLQRCLDLDKVINEPISERWVRAILSRIGEQPDVAKFRGLKLLDRVVCLVQVANDTGLCLAKNGNEIIERYRQEGTEPAQPNFGLFALSDLRQVAGHRKESAMSVPGILARLGIERVGLAQGWGIALDHVYDVLGDQLTSIEKKIRAAIT